MSISRVPRETEQQLIAAGAAESERIGVPMSFAIVDVAGALTGFCRLPGAGWVTADLARGKARAAVAFDAPTSELAERWSGATTFTTALIAQNGGDLVPAAGGIPVVIDGETVGAMGASGGTGAQDAAVVRAALDAVLG